MELMWFITRYFPLVPLLSQICSLLPPIPFPQDSYLLLFCHPGLGLPREIFTWGFQPLHILQPHSCHTLFSPLIWSHQWYIFRTHIITLSFTLVSYYQLNFRSKYLLQNPNIFGKNPLIIHILSCAYCTLNPHFSLVLYFAISLRRPRE